MITVAMPIYNQTAIAWLAMEGLCNQENAEPWELIVFEDGKEPKCGKKFFESYQERLNAVGMVDFTYITQRKRNALSVKWKQIAQLAKGDYFFLQSGDTYQPKHWLAAVGKARAANADMYHFTNGYFYNIPDGRMIKYICQRKGTHLGNFFKTKHIRNLPDEKVWRGVDNWILNSIENPVKKLNIYGFAVLSTDGMNTISVNRKKYYNPIFLIHSKIFEATNKILKDIVPEYIAKRLNNEQMVSHTTRERQL